MCDTFILARGLDTDRPTLFGKNSDRQRNEAHVVELQPAREYLPDAEVSATYISIPQLRETHATLLCRPFWSWGAEMGANDRGVVIGNEGVHGKLPAPQAPALTGMDLVRLALERADSAAHAIKIITSLLERHGQGGNCGHVRESFYNNAFAIADASEAYVLETLDREWLVERVTGVRAISNGYSIEKATGFSAGLLALIDRERWGLPSKDGFARVLSNPDREHIGQAGARRERAEALLSGSAEFAGTQDAMRVLRDHGQRRDELDWRPEPSSARTICMHAGDEAHGGQTTGSMVSALSSCGALHWVTATSAPCLGLFKPVFLDAPLPSHGSSPTAKYDACSLWWRHEAMHRTALMEDFAALVKEIASERNAIEATFVGLAADAAKQDRDARARCVDICWQLAAEAEARWQDRVVRHTGVKRDAMRSAWAPWNELAQFPVRPEIK